TGISDYNKAAYASLLQIPASEEAHLLRITLSKMLFPSTPNQGRGRPININARQEAALAFVADLLRATQRDPTRWVSRGLGANSFSNEYIGYRAFLRAVEALVDARLVVRLNGFWTTNSVFGKLARGHGRATRWQATPRLFALCETYGITPLNASDHFRFR